MRRRSPTRTPKDLTWQEVVARHGSRLISRPFHRKLILKLLSQGWKVYFHQGFSLLVPDGSERVLLDDRGTKEIVKMLDTNEVVEVIEYSGVFIPYSRSYIMGGCLYTPDM